MCGISGVFSSYGNPTIEHTVDRMIKSLRHRGPDNIGIWVSENERCGLGHARLSIIDLSPVSNQPMHYLNRYVLVFNGEIYNYLELKEKLITIGYDFHTDSDAEVVLALYDYKGEKCVADFDGMFSLLLYDKTNDELFGARDRFGEKPFYYHKSSDTLYVASEVKAIKAVSSTVQLDLEAIQDYLNGNGLTSSERTYFSGIETLPPAHYFFFRRGTMDIKRYWSLSPNKQINRISDIDAIDQFDYLLRKSIRLRLRADVPVGCSLSGGLDSSVLAANLHEFADAPLPTFSARFNSNLDEGPWISKLTEKLSLPNTQVWPDANGFISELDKLTWHHEFPVRSGSVYAQWCVMRLAKNHGIKVMLDGQGADEYLAGYDELKYYVVWAYYRKFKLVSYLRERRYFKKTFGAGTSLGLKHLMDPVLMTFGFRRSIYDNGESLRDQSCYYLSEKLGELLRFADRNSMAHGVEVRLPYLSAELIEFTLSLNESLIYRNGKSKYILREANKNRLPPETYYRTDKIGFVAPDQKWGADSLADDLFRTSFLQLEQLGLRPCSSKFRIITAGALIRQFY